jgi:hypothetical protein
VKLEAWLRLRGAARFRLVQRSLLAAGIAWLPPALLAAAQAELAHAEQARSFVLDIGAHTRYLVALPALILAEPACVARLGALARHFTDAGLVAAADRPRFDAATASTRRLLDSPAAAVTVALLAYAFAALIFLTPAHIKPDWYAAPAVWLGTSPAGWWHTLVSLPLLLVLLLAWIWRIVLWGRFLWLVSRLDLRVLPSHPDLAGGLRFVGHSLRAFALPAFGLSVIVAGGQANRTLHEDASPIVTAYVLGGTVVFMLALFAWPLLAFMGKLLAHWQRGVLEYGALAESVGHALERRWLRRTGRPRAGPLEARAPHQDPGEAREPPHQDPLESQAFSAAADLYQVVSNVYGMRLVPLDVTSLALLVLAALLPFLPVLLLAAPLNVLLKNLLNLVF